MVSSHTITEKSLVTRKKFYRTQQELLFLIHEFGAQQKEKKRFTQDWNNGRERHGCF